MTIGIITADRTEQRDHKQKNRILKVYPELSIVEIPPYDSNLFTNEVPASIVTVCRENDTKTAILRTVSCISPVAEEFIIGCSELHDHGIAAEFLDEPWLNTEIWYRKKQTGIIAELHKEIVNATYRRNEEIAERYQKARRIGIDSNIRNGTHPGPKKGSRYREYPEKDRRMKFILEHSPTFNDTARMEKDVYEEMGISEGAYNRYKRELKKLYPERVRDKK